VAPTGPLNESRGAIDFGMFDQGSSLPGRLLPVECLCRNVPPDIRNNSEGMDLSLGSPRPTVQRTTRKSYPCTLALKRALIVAEHAQRLPGPLVRSKEGALDATSSNLHCGKQNRMVAGSAEAIEGKDFLVVGAYNHPNCFVRAAF